ncbi:hypothetical protein [Nitrobacter sp.]|uniref:hypothetical protein n=1 Tax=Nitrobacter sp. TaxID=29420 RepID=UPI0029CAAF19|nr:hypothetical protein [Nitrobacter sp.]
MLEARSSVRPYLICLALQSAAAFALLAEIGRIFRTLIGGLGVLHAVPQIELALLIGTLCVCQIVYWYRLKNVRIPEWRSIVLGHFFGFAGRLSFIFGGALFSLFFLRHAPELSSSENAIVLLPRIAMLLASLFSLYCYSLELERLANTLQFSAGQGSRKSG